MPGYTARAIVVARPGVAAALNAKCLEVDTVGGDRALTVALRLVGDAANTIRAYWCSWALKPAEVTALRSKFQAAGMTAAEVGVVTAAQRGSFTPDLAARMYLFDAREGIGWTPSEVLAVLGLDTLAPTILS